MKKKNKNRPDPLPDKAFDSVPRLALTFTDESIWMTEFDRGEPTVTYPVAYDHVAQSFQVFGSSTGLLDSETLFWKKRGNQVSIAMWIPPSVRTLNFAHGRKSNVAFRVPMPGFVFIGTGKQYSIFAAKSRPLQDTDMLYLAPLPNVNEDGLICAGSVEFPKASATTLRQAATLFFESGFNSDLAQRKVQSLRKDTDNDDEEDEDDDDENAEFVPTEPRVHRSRRGTSRYGNLFQFLRSLKNKTKFPQGELVSAMTVKQLLGKD
jgi:hypothetical protein